MESLNVPRSHPGTFVRQRVIPPGMTVTEASRRLGIGRPALSNFLNGRSSLSPEMAVRLEKAFGADRQHLLDMQAAYDRQERHPREQQVAVRGFVPGFLVILAREIADWANRIDARTHLPVLLRKLVQSTGQGLERVDFPGYDNAQNKGNDGVVKASAATPWIPEGVSYWEFGTSKRPGDKAESDYSARLNSVNSIERARSTFIFVTPRNWPGKTAWEKQKNEAGHWKAVRAFDASDLEQWLEQSVPAQIWLAEQLGRSTEGFETLEQAWKRWANACEPRLTPEVFTPAITAYQGTVKEWLTKPSAKQFVISADSREEAVAFLACLFDTDEFREFKDLTAIFTSPTILRKLIASSISFIPIVISEDVERELIDAHNRRHCVVFRPRNTVDIAADITLDLLSHEPFQKALRAAGVEDDKIDQLARESGRSPTVLRRRLSKNAAIRTPVWAGDDKTAKALVPLTLIGAWNSAVEADRGILARMADREYEAIEGDVMPLLGSNDSPLWSAGSHRGVVSQMDALFGIVRMITTGHLERFFNAAKVVLAETDPALDLPEERRWAAALYGKARDHSVALRQGICDTLTILAVYGNDLFQWRTGIDVERRVSALIHGLLTPMTLEKLLSQDHDLPYYAEAAPHEFLRIVEGDLSEEAPVIFGLLEPVESGNPLAWPSRTGLLWALECLAWNRDNLSRVCRVFARLCESKIDDNWLDTPGASLGAIFRSRMPQTGASVDERIKALSALAKKFPKVGWSICFDEVGPREHFVRKNHRPLWRSDASGAGQMATHGETRDFNRGALGLLIRWPSHDEATLGDLVEILEGIPDEEQNKIWALIDEWSSGASEDAKAVLRERIRRFFLPRRGGHRKTGEGVRDRAREAYERLEAADPVIRHRWLFVNPWVEESAHGSEDEDFDEQEQEERIDRLRRDAMTEIWREYGFEGVAKLLIDSEAPGLVGNSAMSCATSIDERVAFIRRCLSLEGDQRSQGEDCLRGALRAIGDNSRRQLLDVAGGALPPERRNRLFLCAPFGDSTWRLMDAYGDDVRAAYWRNVVPSWLGHTPAERAELIDRLLEAGRPQAAFFAVHMMVTDVETLRLERLLHDLATVQVKETDSFRIQPYYISKAMDSLDGRAGVTRDEMAHLEFLFMEVLYGSKRGIPNIEYIIGESPIRFVQAAVLAYSRDDEGKDPPEWAARDPELRASALRTAHLLFEQLKRVPGTQENGEIDARALAEWLKAVRRLCREYGRTRSGDYCVGQLFANAPEDKDGFWPCRAVCEVLEEIASPRIGEGFLFGVLNSRGAHMRDEGGKQERELAARYRAFAEHLRFDFPYVGGILDEIAAWYDHQASWEDSEAEIDKRLPS